ncbi:PIN2/TERF1-interacting telomerase inhibitor 1-like [Metopolophium dirhodum]|uniref:PIN2/TERF1-interacting telomerase inhibitor 1-like n=1 Tax=Metopolophium dirhodum TaxID=44670 RepID=UPI00298FC810|nr:PIN2/TERF1-interacting telomerase inhibitor 1-like [Metopolophium dirhodum]XP_060870242.1 PIN2/TERF1-interacting telomerase inhibitor 1-like [Metopolophium dirhodum]
MALAEPRKRRKNPMHSINLSAQNHWTNDDSKFGQRMLEKFGWSKGSGLGKNKQGISENIRVDHKVHPTGLGFIANNVDDWFKAGEEYSRLLSQLTEKFDQYQELSESNGDTTSKKSLVQNSLNSKSRVHYHKFTKGKDLTQYKRDELTCILGKGVKDDGEILNGLNMEEYFKSKKERLKIKTDKHDTSTTVEYDLTNNNDNNMQEGITVEEETEAQTKEHEINTTLLKKKKRRAKQLKDTEIVMPIYDDIHVELKKKKKKTKELICEKIDDVELLKKKPKKNKLPINEDLDDNMSEGNNNKTLEENDADEQDSELVLTHKYQKLVDLLIENSSAGNKYCKDSTSPLFQEKMKEFADSVTHQCLTTVGSTEIKSSLKKETTTLKPIILNPDDKNFIKDFEEQKSQALEMISKRQQLAKYVNEKSMFIANHGDVLFFGSNINDIKGYGEW